MIALPCRLSRTLLRTPLLIMEASNQRADHSTKNNMKRKGEVRAESVAKVPSPSSTPEDLISVDGSTLEGGGQILRNVAALAVITGKAVRVSKIRAGRDKPGLRPQHLTGIELAARISRGRLDGGSIGSTEICLFPGQVAPTDGPMVADTGTAGSCTLLAQTALPILLFLRGSHRGASQAEGAVASQPGGSTVAVQVVLKGGTDVPMAPPVDYLAMVLLPLLQRHIPPLDSSDAPRVNLLLERRGFYPRGGGVVRLSAHPLEPGAKLQPIVMLERGRVLRVRGRAFGASQDVEGIVAAASKVLRKDLGASVEIALDGKEAPGQQGSMGRGFGITLVAETDSGCLLGSSARGPDQKKSPRDIGSEAAEELLSELAAGGCVDQYMQDQLVIFMAMADGKSAVAMAEPTLHTRTAVFIAEQLLGVTFNFSEEKERVDEASKLLVPKRWVVECQGVGMAVPV